MPPFSGLASVGSAVSGRIISLSGIVCTIIGFVAGESCLPFSGCSFYVALCYLLGGLFSLDWCFVEVALLR